MLRLRPEGRGAEQFVPANRKRRAMMTRIRLLLSCAYLAGALGSIGCSPTAAQVGSAPPKQDWIPGPAGRIYIDDGGEGGGLPVVFAHSYAGNTTHWAAQLAHLRASRRAVAFD